MIRVDRKVTHGRHCLCSACAREDWTRPELACCGMHGPECPANYAPAKSIPTEPHGYRAEGDERIRTAVCAPGADPVYERQRTKPVSLVAYLIVVLRARGGKW